MGIKSLPDDQREVILQCMKAIASSQLIEDCEMHTRLGINRSTLNEIIARWPDIDDSVLDSDEFLAINNCMNEICNGLRISVEEWDKLFSATRSQVAEVYAKWAGRRSGYGVG